MTACSSDHDAFARRGLLDVATRRSPALIEQHDRRHERRAVEVVIQRGIVGHGATGGHAHLDANSMGNVSGKVRGDVTSLQTLGNNANPLRNAWTEGGATWSPWSRRALVTRKFGIVPPHSRKRQGLVGFMMVAVTGTSPDAGA
ncbi:MAG: hypothetical protein U0169_26430 [Polyangiaceae bacterium]